MQPELFKDLYRFVQSPVFAKVQTKCKIISQIYILTMCK
jgi:hypothetical protein